MRPRLPLTCRTTTSRTRSQTFHSRRSPSGNCRTFSRGTSPMTRNRIRDIYPLAPLQQGMLFHSLSDAVPGMYCEQIVGEVACGLDAERFRAALAHLVKRHDALRSAFVWQDVDEPLQVVQDDAIVPLTV